MLTVLMVIGAFAWAVLAIVLASVVGRGWARPRTAGSGDLHAQHLAAASRADGGQVPARGPGSPRDLSLIHI